MIPVNIDINLQSEIWVEYCPEYTGLMESCFEQVMKLVPEAEFFKDIPHLELSILLTDDQNIRRLNKTYRGKDKATNILSFPSLSNDDIQNYQRPDCEFPEYPVTLGDIIFAFETMKCEASAQGKKFSDHFCHLFIHGILHLLGYDHAGDIEAQAMENMEKKLLLKLSIDDPYQD